MIRINVSRKSAKRNTPATLGSVAWGKNNFETISVLAFAGLLIACSLGVGCSSEKSKPQTPTVQIPPQTMVPVSSPVPVNQTTSTAQDSDKLAHKRVVRRAPVTVAYTDKASGVTFRYPRKYVLKTGDAADEVVSSALVPMNFSQPGGVAIATVAIPEGAYPKSDLASALFDVSVNKSITTEQCGEFASAHVSSAAPNNDATPQPPAVAEASSQPAAQKPKLIIGDMELQSAETEDSSESRKEATKYYHVFENGACYEFALKVATAAGETDEGGKPVERDEIFKRLEKILATVKITPIAIEREAAIATVPAPTSPAQ